MIQAQRQFTDDYWEFLMEAQPSIAHVLGDYRYTDRVEDARIASLRDFAAQARTLYGRSSSYSSIRFPSGSRTQACFPRSQTIISLS